MDAAAFIDEQFCRKTTRVQIIFAIDGLSGRWGAGAARSWTRMRGRDFPVIDTHAAESYLDRVATDQREVANCLYAQHGVDPEGESPSESRP